MPPFPGEETLTTVYTDLHTYFDAPTPRPFLHRFDKASYFYVYYNSTRQTTRVEVALNPGTADQAAFNGFLDNVKVTHSHRFPTRLTLVVDAASLPAASPSSPRPGRDADEWRLASADPRDAGTSKYRIHTIDFYFWQAEDATLFVEICKKLLQPHQLDIDEVPVPEEEEPDHHDLVSPVVQNLEQAAISDPAYYKDRQLHAPAAAPPPPAVPKAQPAVSPSRSHVGANFDGNSSLQAQAQDPSTSYVPLAYNPAAPPAPEPIAHREDTPPPVDAADGTGLATAAMHDNAYVHQPHQQAHGAVPGSQPNQYGHYGSPPPPSFGPHAAASAQQPSFGPQAAAPTQPSFGPQRVSSALQTSPRTSVSTTFGPPPTSATSADTSQHPSISAQNYNQNTQDPNAHIFGPPSAQTPGTQFYSTINNQTHKPLQHVQPQYPDYLAAGQSPPLGGYASYNYGHAQQSAPAAAIASPGAVAGNPYDIHSQVYRPTEEEHHTHHHSKPSRKPSAHHEPSGVEKIEKGVGRFFKKIEKKIG